MQLPTNHLGNPRFFDAYPASSTSIGSWQAADTSPRAGVAWDSNRAVKVTNEDEGDESFLPDCLSPLAALRAAQ